MKLYPKLFLAFLLLIFSCNKKEENTPQVTGKSGNFSWHDDLKAADIPDYQLRSSMNGNEISFGYINFEKWRGSNDNVINFSLHKPQQQCGFIEDFEGFVLMRKGGSINVGEWTKSKFSDDPKSYSAYFKSAGKKSGAGWNCALKIESMSDKTLKGKIALYFNDEQKSFLAGSFEAVVCNN